MSQNQNETPDDENHYNTTKLQYDHHHSMKYEHYVSGTFYYLELQHALNICQQIASS